MRAFGLGAAALALAAGPVLAAAPMAPVPGVFSFAQARYLESCGGCHGLQGRSWDPDVPRLESVVGQFLCSAAARDYVVRLPNVAFARQDDAALTELLNFVMFTLGGDSVPAGARPYTVDEVAALRRQPLKNRDVLRLRGEVLGAVAADCGGVAAALARQ